MKKKNQPQNKQKITQTENSLTNTKAKRSISRETTAYRLHMISRETNKPRSRRQQNWFVLNKVKVDDCKKRQKHAAVYQPYC
jgi:hypothetical protein